MLARPSIKMLRQCDVKINTKNSVFWKHIPSLKAWIFLTKNPEPIIITCKKVKTEKGHITNSGILRLSAGCIARTKHNTLIILYYIYIILYYIYTTFIVYFIFLLFYKILLNEKITEEEEMVVRNIHLLNILKLGIILIKQ